MKTAQEKVLIIGVTGIIGVDLKNKLSKYYRVIGTSRISGAETLQFNLSNFNDFGKLPVDENTVVLILAGVTSPDFCTNHPQHAWEVNVTQTGKLIKYLLSHRARVIFFSSDTVYGESVNDFDESRPPAPVGTYASTKFEIEQRFEGNDRFKSIRVSYVVSRRDKFTLYLEASASTQTIAEVYHPHYRSAISICDLVDGIHGLIKNWDSINLRNINFGGPITLSRLALADAMRILRFPNLRYAVVDPPYHFARSRAQRINMRSPLLRHLIGRDPCNFNPEIFDNASSLP
jgi:nucleoside-diphosphate-sugar epimerase